MTINFAPGSVCPGGAAIGEFNKITVVAGNAQKETEKPSDCAKQSGLSQETRIHKWPHG